MIKPDELGRDGLAHLTQRVIEEKLQKRSTLFKTLAGASALAIVVGGLGAAGLASYTYYTDTVYSPEYVEQYEKVKQIEAQETLSAEQKKLADEAIERARIETEAVQKAAQEKAEAEKPQKMLDEMFQRTEMKDAVCYINNIELTGTFNAKGELTDFKKTYGTGLAGENEAKAKCETDFSMDNFTAARGLGPIPATAHYTQLKDMWSLCRGGFKEPDLSVTNYKDGSTKVYYQLYASRYEFGNAKEYQDYQACMTKALSAPQIKQVNAMPVVAGP